MATDDKFFICNLDSNSRLIGGEEYYMMQVKEGKKWSDKFCWYSIEDAVRGCMRYLLNKDLRNVGGKTINALLSTVQSTEIKIDRVCDRLIGIFNDDLIEKELKELNGQERTTD